ncbi:MULTISPECIES: GGDEF domain-containing protein [unclassified Actinoplanes]|uniref:GGDEF domain-containing protein n=1 Tax=unclassified Actinoplanes TaxID=2626549 RepID=UPI0002E0E77B|nr:MULTISPECIES: GGDEF domain-containing protein [unclassified Actinoplanes]
MRLGLAAMVAAFWIFLPGQRRTDGKDLFAVALLCAWATVLTVAAPRVGRRMAIVAVNIALLVDGLGLATALHAYGGVSGPISVLMVLHVCGVSLLTSFRSGGKVAVWHALLVLCVLQAEQVGLLTVKQPAPLPMAGYVTFVALLGAAALATSLYAALNERELRRRRYDAEVLRSLAVHLEASNDLGEIAAALTRLAVEDLLAVRALVVIEPASDEEGRGLRFVEKGWPPLPAALDTGKTAHAHGSLLADTEAGPVLVRNLDKQRDSYVVSRLPGAERLAVLPIPLGPAGRGHLVLDMGRSKRVEHRMMSTLIQATAHVGLALTRAGLVERLRLAAETDGLTGVANRKFFDAALAQHIDHAMRTGEPLAVTLVDLDFFKKVNDTYGHQTGDEVLKAAAAALRSTAREGDVVARYGGEEFAVILPGVPVDDVWQTAERFRNAVRTCPAPVPVTCSMGIASLPPGGVPPTVLLEAADQALYRAKEAGRNRVEIGHFTDESLGTAVGRGH